VDYQQREDMWPMTEVLPDTIHIVQLRQGDRVKIQSPGYPPYHGLVEDSMPALDVVWIRELRTGERKMLWTAEHHIDRA
jgi:hypothetical protein